MEREIKFRAWDKDMKEFRDIRSISFIGKPNKCVFRGSQHGNDFEKSVIAYDGVTSIVLMQFTGLKDSKGVEIYEGDIVKVYDQETRKVVFANAFWRLDLCETTVLGGFGTPVEAGHKPLYRYGKHLEVIGNIYENENLLNP